MQNFKYLSPEWAQEATRRLKQDLTPEEMKHLTSSMLTAYTNCPDGMDRAVYYRVVDGVVEEVSLQGWTFAKSAVLPSAWSPVSSTGSA